MNKIANVFQNGKAFIPFVTCGYPDLATSEQLIRSLATHGADIIEIGIPFSDPTAEDPVAQKASIHALNNGVTTDTVFTLIEKLRKEISLPIVLMAYANVVFSYGIERFMATASKVGVDGVILPDVPFEEREEFSPLCQKYNLTLISTIAPTSKKRIATIAAEAEGFLYLNAPVEERLTIEEKQKQVSQMIDEVRRVNKQIPCALHLDTISEQNAPLFFPLIDGIIDTGIVSNLLQKKEEQAQERLKELAHMAKANLCQACS